MKKFPASFALPLIGGALVLLLAACSKSPSETAGQAEVERAFIEGADLAVYADLKAISDSPLSKKLDKMQEEKMDELSESLNDSDSPDPSEIEEKLEEITGLTSEDVTHFALTVGNISAAQTDPTAVAISGAVYADKPVTAEQLVEAAKYLSAQNGEPIDLSVTKEAAADFIIFPNEPGDPAIVAAVVTGTASTTVFFGDRASVDGALGRPSGTVPSQISDPSANLVPGQQAWLSFILPDELKGMVGAAADQGVRMAPGLDAIKSLQSVGLAMTSSDSLDFALGLNLATEEDAAKITAVLQNQLISMAKMLLSGKVSEPLPVLESMTAGQNGDRATLGMTMTVKDFEILGENALGFLNPSGFQEPASSPSSY